MATKLTCRADIPAVLAELTAEEKLRLLGAVSSVTTAAMPAHGIPAIHPVDGATGVNFSQLFIDYADRTPAAGGMGMFSGMAKMDTLATAPLAEAEAAVAGDDYLAGFLPDVRRARPRDKQFISFPSGVNIGAAWDPEMARRIGEAVGWELRDSGVDVCLGPNVDLQRDPLGGRNYEMYGEDPVLVGRTGAAFIRGMQSTGVAACAKHYMANNQETRRNTVNEHISPRALRELYAYGFRAAVQEGGVKTVMAAYNAINGHFSSSNRWLLTEQLREEWGFEGAVVSDWGGATETQVASLNAGLDLMLPAIKDLDQCRQGLADGTLTMETVDAHVTRVLELVCDVVAAQAAVPAQYDEAALLETARATVAAGAVLLKNEGDVLPLTGEVSFWGARSRELITCGTGSTAVVTARRADVLSETARLLGGKQVHFEAYTGTVVYTAGAAAGEGADRAAMRLDPADEAALPAVLREAKTRGLRTVVLLNISGPVDMRPWLADADAVLCVFIPGCEGGVAAAELLTGRREPGGRLPITLPLRYEDTPAYPNFPGEHDDSFYGEGIFIGYRSYEKRGIPVCFPFGHGLSYTSFTQKPLTGALRFDIPRDETLTVPVEVTNTGSRPGSQVIQLYAAERNPELLRPAQELRAFAKVTLQPGETRTVELTLRRADLACYDPRRGAWVTPVGAYVLRLGTSSADIFAELNLTVAGPNPFALGPDSTLGKLCRRPDAIAVLNRHLPGVIDPDNSMMTMLSDRAIGPLLSGIVIRFQPDAVKAAALLENLYKELAALDAVE